MKNNKKMAKGITLIALVVTIIVLLILAGISIAMLSGNNGILQRATEAKQDTERQSIVEQARTDVLGYQVENKGTELQKSQLQTVLETYFKNVPTELPDGESLSNLELTTLDKYGTYQIKVSEIYNGSLTNTDSGEATKGPNGKPLVNKDNIPETSHDKIIGEDSNGNQVVVPDGFKVADDSGTTVKDGIVIEDDEENQYVWIPVSNINHDGSNKIKVNSADEEGVEITLGRYTFARSSPGEPTLGANSYQYATTYATPVTIDNYYQELTTYQISNGLGNQTGTNTTARGIYVGGAYNGIKGFIDSVETNKGYYIARYEASYRTNEKAGSIPTTLSEETLASINSSNNAPSIRNPGDLWYRAKQREAANACYDLYTTVNSDLMNSYSWDTTILYIQAMGNVNYANSYGHGNSNNLENTGDTGDEKCKIFDLSGNNYEWTTEYSSYVYNSNYAYPCVSRGGCNGTNGLWTSKRTYDQATAYAGSFGFRSLLYL